MTTKFSDKLTYDNGKLPEFSVDVFLESLFLSDAQYIKDRVIDLLQRERGPIHKDFDLDDCLASRKEILNIPWFRNNRWSDGNIWLYAHYWNMIDQNNHDIITDTTKKIVLNMSKEEKKIAEINFIEREYRGQNCLWLVKNIDELFWDKFATYWISTAGIQSIQEAKIWALFWDHWAWIKVNEIKVVNQSKDKIKRNLLSLLDKDYLPKEYVMHEDRPEWFHMYDQVLSNVLQTDVTVNSIYISKYNEAVQKWSVKHSPKDKTIFA